ncbi:MAG: HlyD family efflux transporter periplasmic adaptor subunit [Candidatus Pedobacter colombiensis]|uniref:HlyD family efflux transporter periplasmic adaptor subunit n=1 Tax=Candidatus Pedobacter colombiensis TaxID=3121371 RepID=A0AAJ5W5U9_9SPHI|nr:HlyD family efflux transporter periplasmic adaptor subunit [Pedobacter sp.]WEK18125.1 MAG: HlyD family efflux transporter periplasmic adaptor subunit [Pedobacter sp.]
MKKISFAAITILFLISCGNKEQAYDASGTFEAVETIVSAEATGVIKALNLEEGQVLKAGETVGYIDSTQLYLKKKQLEAQITAVLVKKPDVAAQVAAYQEQLKQALREQRRITNMLKSDAATPKQLDDANAQVAIIKKQIAAQESTLGITSAGLNKETLPLDAQIEQLNDQLSKSKIVNEVEGTVLTKYAEVNEMAITGKPLYKISDLSSIILRAYITGNQLPSVKLGQKVEVLVDDANGKYKTYDGTIEWVSDKAEFTPKTIQTKDERANLVYAIKIKVKNDGYLKIGMYGEIRLAGKI